MATLKITPRVMSIGGRMIQISNIAEASLWEDFTARKQGQKLLGTSGLFLLIIVVAIANAGIGPVSGILAMLAVCGIIIGIIMMNNVRYELILQTNAGKITPLSSPDKSLLDQILMQLHIAMSHENPSQNYTVTIGDNIINSVVGSSVGGNVELRQSK